ncbi:hypothetical protein V6N13_037677 [Hibiscus sabdariffa]
MLQQSEKEKSNNLNFVGRKEDESMNLRGVAVDSEEAAYNLYKDYGHRMGFSVRRGRNRYVSGTNVIRCKDYFCSKEGFKEFEGDINVKQYNKLETRTGCQAMIRFTMEDNIWTVTRFISEHNHELATPSKRHLLRSARSLLTTKANVIGSMYISKRWTKAAKKNVHVDKIGEFSQQHTTEVDIESVFRNRMVRFAYDFIVKSQVNEKTRELCQKILYEGNLKVEEELTNLCDTKTCELRKDKTKASKVTTQTRNVRRSLIEELPKNDDEIKGCANNNSHVSDPPCVRPKGISNARLKCHLEKRKSKASTSTKQIGQSLDAFVGTTPRHDNFVFPSVIMPTSNIFIPPYQNTMQFSNMGPGSSWYSDALNFPHRILEQNNATTTLNLMSQEPYKYSEGHPNPKL